MTDMSNESINRITEILNRARNLARNMGHRYVTIDHLFFELFQEEELFQFLTEMDVDVNTLLKRLSNFLKGIDQKSSRDPIKTEAIKRLLNRTISQTKITGSDEAILLGLIFALLYEPETATYNLLKKSGANIEAMRLALMEVLDLHKGGLQNTSPINLPEIQRSLMGNREDKNAEMHTEVLKKYCINLNDLVKEGKIDPVIGRNKEIEQIELILGKKIKRNAILVGDAGTGKSAIVDGLAIRLVEDNVPEQLKGYEIYNLNLGTLIAGTRYRGDFEQRLEDIIAALKHFPNVILFIDEMHMAKGSGSGGDGSMDVANILKPALARGKIKVIGATTTEEYKKYIEKDKAFARRFFKIDVNEPSVDDTKKILYGVISHFEVFHGVEYTLEAIDKAVDLAAKYIHNKKFPDKAFDIIDAAGSAKKMFYERKTEDEKLVISEKRYRKTS